MFSVVIVFSMLGLGCILISDLVVANLLMYSLPGMIILYLAAPFFTKGVLDEIRFTEIYTAAHQIYGLLWAFWLIIHYPSQYFSTELYIAFLNMHYASGDNGMQHRQWILNI